MIQRLDAFDFEALAAFQRDTVGDAVALMSEEERAR